MLCFTVSAIEMQHFSNIETIVYTYIVCLWLLDVVFSLLFINTCLTYALYAHSLKTFACKWFTLGCTQAFHFHPFSICLIVSILSSFFCCCWFIIYSSDCFHRLYYFVMCEEGLSSSCLFMIFTSILVVLFVLVCFIVDKSCVCVCFVLFCIVCVCARSK